MEGLVILAIVTCPHPRSRSLTRPVSRRKGDAQLRARGIREIVIRGWWVCTSCGSERPGPSY